MTTALDKWARQVSRAAIPLENLRRGPWKGSKESVAADEMGPEFADGSQSRNMLYLPRTGTFRRMGGQVALFGSEDDGLLPGSPAPPEFYSWSDNRDTNAQVYLQKVTDGVAQWTDDGLLVSAATAGTSTAAPSAIVKTTDSGVVILYRENIGGVISVMAQRYNSEGVKQWTSTGVVISNATSTYASVVQHSFAAMSDGGSGFIFAWQDNRTGEQRMYVQKVNSAGVVQWTANGVSVMPDTGTDSGVQHGVAFSDGAGGVYVTGWRTNGANPELSFQRISSAGALLWGATGLIPVAGIEQTFATQAFPRQNCATLSDGALAFAYTTGAYPSNALFVRKLSAAAGATVWTTATILAGGEVTETYSISLVPATDGGVLILYVTRPSAGGAQRIKARRINSDGSLGFGPLTVHTGVTSSGARVCAVTDGSNGAMALFSQTSPTAASTAHRVLSTGAVAFSGVLGAGAPPHPSQNTGANPVAGVDGSLISVGPTGTTTTITAYRVNADGTVITSTLIADAVGAGNDNKVIMSIAGSA